MTDTTAVDEWLPVTSVPELANAAADEWLPVGQAQPKQLWSEEDEFLSKPIPQAFLDRFEKGAEATKREGGIVQTVPQFAGLLSSPEGRTKLWDSIKAYPAEFVKGMIEQAKVPGEVAKGNLDLSTPDGMDQAIGLGTLIGFGRFSKLPLTGQTSGMALRQGQVAARIERAPTGEIHDLPIGELPKAEDFANAAQDLTGGEHAPLRITVPVAGKPNPETIVGAAVRAKDGRIFASDTHSGASANAADFYKVFDPYEHDLLPAADLDGFLTSKGRFVDRKEALEIATRAEQEGEYGKSSNELRGEQLYNLSSMRLKDALDIANRSPIEQKLTRLWEDHGIHPAEVAHDAQHDVTVKQALLSSASDLPQRYIQAYHGSPHDFEAFDISKIGTGEGAQSYGHGLYFAENPSVAQSYKSAGRMGADVGTPEVYARAALNEGKTSLDLREQAKIERAKDTAIGDHEADHYDRAADLIDSGQIRPSSLYQVRILADREHFLDWDKPLSEQSPYVQDAVKRIEGAVKKTEAMPNADWHEKANGRLIFGDGLAVIEKKVDGYFVQSDALKKTFPTLAEAKKAGEDYVRRSFEDSAAAANNVSGVQIMRNIGDHLAGGDEIRGQLMRAEVSAALRDAGIPGIKYIDQGSRGAAEGTHNFVVFDDKSVEITHKNGEPLTKQERADAVSSMMGEGGKPPPPTEVPPPAAASPPPPPPGSFAEAQQKVMDKISVGETAAPRKLTWDRLYAQLVDDLHPINKISEDAYQLARLTRGQFGKATQFLEHGTFDFNTYKTNGKSLREILAPVRDDLNGLRAYLASSRALEIEASGRKSGIDVEAAQKVVDEGKGKYATIAKEVSQYQTNVLKYLKDSGVLKDTSFDAMQEANKNYVPFYRLMGDTAAGGGAGKSFGPGNPVKRLKGSERTVIDPLESIIKNTYAYISVAERNAVGIKVIDALKAAGKEIDIAVQSPPPPSRIAGGVAAVLYNGKVIRGRPGETHADILERNNIPFDTPHPKLDADLFSLPNGEIVNRGEMVRRGLAETAEDLRDFGLRPTAEQMATPFELRKQPRDAAVESEIADYLKANGVEKPPADLINFIRTASEDGETIGAYRDGVRETVKITDPDLLKAYRGLDVQASNMLTRVLAVPAKTLRAGAVLTPDFMARNLIRDFITAFINSKGLFSPIDTAKGFGSLIRKDADFQNWLKSGGANSTLVALDRRYLQESLSKLSDDTGLMTRAWNVIQNPIKENLPGTAINKALEPLRMLSELAENATRLGEFKKVAAGSTAKEDLQSAGMASREVTLDFARIGASTRAYNMITAFGNAQIQGVDRMVRAFKDRPANTMLKIAGAVTLPSVLLWFANHDDPRYQELPAWQKDLFWIILTKDNIYRIPKPFEIGVLFGSGAERALDATLGKNPEAYDHFAKSVMGAFLPNVTPTIAAPIIEQFANRSTFTDRSLIPADMEKHLPEYQYTPYTTELTKSLGQIIAAFPGIRSASLEHDSPLVGGTARAITSPILMENYVRAWTGNLGTYALQFADYTLRKAGVVPDPEKPASTLADIPFVRAFVVRYPTASAQSIQDFYDEHAKIKSYYDTWLAKAKEGDEQAVARIQAAGGPRMFVQLDGIRQTLSEHSQMVRDIYKMPGVPPEEKRQLIDQLYYSMIELGQYGKAALRQVESAQAALGDGSSDEIKHKEGGGTNPASGYPSDEEAQSARDAGLGYGTDLEPYIQGQIARIIGSPTKSGFVPKSVSGMTSTQATEAVNDELKSRHISFDLGYVPEIRRTMANVYTKASIVASHIPIVAVGLDPSKVAADIVSKNINVAGAYNPKTDTTYISANDESAIVHEAIHRGLKILRQDQNLKNAFRKLPDEESVVRYLMATAAGDPEDSGGEIDKRQRGYALAVWNNEKQSAIDQITEAAQQLVKRRRPGGPR